MLNRLSDYLRAIEHNLNSEGAFTIHLLILAKDDSDTILAEKW